jgi:hypothetical protein
VFAERETMGSIEVYDYKKMQWVPYVPDFNKWISHFEDISAGRVHPDYKGRYIVGSGAQHRVQPPSEEKQPSVQLVTPVAQAIEMARSELKRENQNAARKPIRKRPAAVYPPPGKRAKKSRQKALIPKLSTQFDD